MVIDQDYQILAANRAYQKHYGMESEDLVGRCCYEVSHHSDVPCSQNGEQCPLEEVFATRQPTQVMHIHYDKNNKEEYVQLQAAPILSNDGEVMYMGEYVQVLSQPGDEDTLLVGGSPAFLRMTSCCNALPPPSPPYCYSAKVAPVRNG